MRSFATLAPRLALASFDPRCSPGSLSQRNTKNRHFATTRLLLLCITEAYSHTVNCGRRLTTLCTVPPHPMRNQRTGSTMLSGRPPTADAAGSPSVPSASCIDRVRLDPRVVVLPRKRGVLPMRFAYLLLPMTLTLLAMTSGCHHRHWCCGGCCAPCCAPCGACCCYTPQLESSVPPLAAPAPPLAASRGPMISSR